MPLLKCSKTEVFKRDKVLVIINIPLLSGKQELFMGVNFFLRSFSLDHTSRPAHGLADAPLGKARIQSKVRGGLASKQSMV